VGWGRSHQGNLIYGSRRNTVVSLPSSSGLLAGDLRIYSAPKALLRHIQWSLNEIFGYPVELHWEQQHLAPGALATQLQWRELKPVASKIASTLKSWHYLRFEVREFSNISGKVFSIAAHQILDYIKQLLHQLAMSWFMKIG
jgi:hypothetical protein